jgi:hypothetical protein
MNPSVTSPYYDGSTAEFVVERPYTNYPLARYWYENWIGATVSTSTNSGAINSGLYNLTSITMVGSSGASLASGGSLGLVAVLLTRGCCGP